MTIKKTPLFLGTGIVLLAALDQASKWLASVRLVEPVLLFPGVSLAYRQNTGIAWSIQMPYLLLMALNFALVAVFIRIAVKYFALDRPISRIAIMLVLAGGCGNIIDRLARGYVIDFISVWIWPVFNLADIFLTAGIFLILLFYGRIKRN